MQASGVLSMLMPKGQSIVFPMPWDRPPDSGEPVPGEVVDEMRERLQKYSAFND